MTIRPTQYEIDDKIPVRHVLISVSDKSALEELVPELISINHGVQIYSTGGTFKKLQEILRGDTGHLRAVEEFTDLPEMEGGLVKTLHPRVFAGLLGERNNPAHVEYLKRIARHAKFVGHPRPRLEDVEPDKTEYTIKVSQGEGVFFDLAIVNLYPFSKTVASPTVTFEDARGNIDIGGPSMVRAAAKNFHSVAPIVDPGDYPALVRELEANGGRTGFDFRFRMMQKAFAHTGQYDAAIVKFMASQTPAEARKEYTFRRGT